MHCLSILDSSSSTATTVTYSYGWWIKRIHISRFYITVPRLLVYSNGYGARLYLPLSRTISKLRFFYHTTLLQSPNFHCRTTAPWSFGSIADEFKTYASRRLHTVHWNVTVNALSKVIWALVSLSHIDIETIRPTMCYASSCICIGSNSSLI